MKIIWYKMFLYDEFMEEYNYRKSHYGVQREIYDIDRRISREAR